GKDIHATVSIGISLYDSAVRESNDLLAQADLALYRAKDLGRDRFNFYSAEMDTKVRERVAIGEELHSAIKNGELELYYQPQIDFPSEKIIGAEALIRWNHPTRGMVSPDQFIPIAEKTGLILELGTWAIQEACRQVGRWHGEELAIPMMGVNVSAVQFRDLAALLETVHDAASSPAMNGCVLELELTESVLIDATDAHCDILDRFRKLGVRIAIDDFGTGFSSLEYLHAYPINRLKIAQQFMRGVPAAENDGEIVKAIIALAAALKLETIAEGVETRDQLEFLSQAGCRSIQGYYFSPPVPAQAITALLRREKSGLPLAARSDRAVSTSDQAPPAAAIVVSGPSILSLV